MRFIFASFFFLAFFAAEAFAQDGQSLGPESVLVYERSEEPRYNNYWGKTYLTEATLSKNKLGQILHTSGKVTQIFDPTTFLMTEAVGIIFEMDNIQTNKKDLSFAKNTSWSVSFQRPNNTSNTCPGTILKHYGEITSQGDSTAAVVINGEKQEISVTEVVWNGTWDSCYSGNFVRKVKYSQTLQALVSVDYVFYYLGSVSGGYKLQLKEIKKKN